MRLIDADEFEKYVRRNCKDSLADLWCELIRRQPTRGAAEAQQWIPVTERLPDEKTDVLCFYRNRTGYEQMTVGFIENDTWWSNEDGTGMTLSYDDPVAWMPLPEPYQGGDVG